MAEEYRFGYDYNSFNVDNGSKHPGKRGKVWIIIAAASGVIILSVIAFLIYCQMAVEPIVYETTYYELGYFASPSATDFVEGKEWLLKYVDFDRDGFDYKVAGNYEFTVSYGLKKFYFDAVVQDTEPPTIKLTTDPVYVKVVDGRLDYHDLIKEVSDVGSKVITRPGTCPSGVYLDGDYFAFSEVGEFIVSVDAYDEFGNKKREVTKVTADTAPVITGFPDYYVATGSEIEFLNGIQAYDDVDGDVTYSLTYDLGEYDSEKPGEYSIVYTATDLYGLSNSAEMLVHVDTPLDLQERINRHEIDRHVQIIYGAINLYDCGYPLSPDMSMEEIMLQYEPAFVAVTTGVRGGAYSRGSGFIVQIDDVEGWVYIMTNNHVTSASKKYYNIDFYDGTKLESELVARSGKTNVSDDLAIVRVKMSDIPEELMDKLVTVHIEREYWLNLEERQGLKTAMLVEEDSVGSRPRKYSEGALLSTHTTDRIVQNVTSELVVEVTIKLYHGCSGSAIIDEHGNLISIASAMTHMNPDRYWGPTVVKILDFYEKSTGVKLNYK